MSYPIYGDYLNICNKCGTELEGEDLINGCPKCGSKLFKFVNTNTAKKNLKNKKSEDRGESSLSKDSIESVKVEDRGVYELNLNHLLAGETNIYSDNEGNYAIDISALLKKGIKNKQKK
jgi:predicted  nucleic acid-binding Zn-ribbon protein